MKYEDLTIKEAKEIAAVFGGSLKETPFSVGEKWFIRTCTYHLTGRITAVVGGFLRLEKCAWVADSGRFYNSLKDGTMNEVEPMPDGTLVSIASIVDAAPWHHELPTSQK